MKNNRSLGCDELSALIYKYGGETLIKWEPRLLYCLDSGEFAVGARQGNHLPSI